MPFKRVLVFIICCWSAVLVTGLTSELYLGDESYHYRYAKQFLETGRRPVFEAAYGSPLPPGYFFSSEPLWPFLLAAVWKAAGGVSFPVAQAYHSLYYLALLCAVYCTARRMYDAEHAAYAVLLAATMPMIAVFGTVFYLDVPMTLFVVAAILCLAHERFALAGIALGVALLTKRTAIFFVPGILLAALVQRRAAPVRTAARAALMLGIIACFYYADQSWRDAVFSKYALLGMSGETFSSAGVSKRFAFSLSHLLDQWRGSLLGRTSEIPVFINPGDLARYAGVGLAICLGVYVARRGGAKQDALLWLPFASFAFCFLYFFGPFADVRYFLPAALLSVIPLAGVLRRRVSGGWFRMAVLVVCLAQAAVALAHLHARRRFPPDLKAAVAFLKAQTPSDAVVFYPGQILLEAADRKVVWSRFGRLQTTLMLRDGESLYKEFQRMGLDYIVIDNRYVYDDARGPTAGGYPQSFVRGLADHAFLEQVYKNATIGIWRVARSRAP